MANLITEEVRARAEIYEGDEICRAKTRELLTQKGLPNGLLPLLDMEECGIVRDNGFVWVRQKKKTTHKFVKINKLVSYDPLITAFVLPGRFTKVTGVKSKEFLLWLSIVDISLDARLSDQIVFKVPSGLYKTFHVSDLQVEEDDNKDDEAEKQVAAPAGVLQA